jgi:PAS domain S-box-containing protein
MGLRQILMVLSLLAFLSASAGGSFYYLALRQAAFKEADRQAVASTELIRKSLNSLLLEHQKPAATLASMPALQSALRSGRSTDLYDANVVLDRFKSTLDADVCYLMNRQGMTIASSNRNDPDSFVGKNFSFRPYFKQAIRGVAGVYLAVGTTSKKRGVYHSHPIFDDPEAPPIGLAVIKSPVDKAETALGLPGEDIFLVTDPRGLIFISNRPEWLFQSIMKLSDAQQAAIARERQFGKGPWIWVGLKIEDASHALDASGRRYLMHSTGVDMFPGWEIIHLRNTEMIAKAVSAPLVRIAGPLVILLSALICAAVLVLYQKASREIARRRIAEQALRQSESRYRALYHNTPAMLHSIDTEGCLLSVSDYWVETMGYRREEVIGRPLGEFLTPASRRQAEEEVFPAFFRTGFCKDVPYQFVKKNGEIFDVVLSGIADRNPDGTIVRSLAVSIDVTERKKADTALRAAKEALSRYSRELEKQVAERTSEISSILKYTPSVIYMKDTDYRYLLVNSRFEELFGVRSEKIRGRTDADVLPAEVAGQFRKHEAHVLAEGASLHVEEQIEQEDGRHTYLSVKFPIFAESGAVLGVCGIASDITPVKKAQEQLRRLSGSIMANQEKERAAIARELHDELGQILTALRMDAVWLKARFKKGDAKGAERAEAMRALIDTTIEEVRGLAIRLRPGVLDDLGLVDALEWYTTEFERRVGIPCLFSSDSVPSVDEILATAAYRIAQEALTNVARHADASSAQVSLRLEDGRLCLTISDDGCGFSPASISENEELGLAGMRERASLVGGTLTVDSQPQRGTRVCLQVNLSAHKVTPNGVV